jgi:hypothetical protein
VVVETFVTPPWRGTCYQAANWLHLGQTAGTGRQDRKYEDEATVREVFVYPLQRDWREALTADNAAQSQGPSRKGEQTMSGSEQLIKKRYDMMAPFLDEKQRRLLAGTEAVVYGTGGLKSISALLGMSTATVSRGMKEARNPETIEQDRIRQPGGGRKPATEIDPELTKDLEQLISPDTRGDPQSPLRWTSKSTRNLADELKAMKPGRSVSPNLVGILLHEHITQNWRGRPLVSHETIVNLIANTTTKAGLIIQCQLDTQEYPKGIKVSDKELAAVHIERSEFHGEWNYAILPKN